MAAQRWKARGPGRLGRDARGPVAAEDIPGAGCNQYDQRGDPGDEKRAPRALFGARAVSRRASPPSRSSPARGLADLVASSPDRLDVFLSSFEPRSPTAIVEPAFAPAIGVLGKADRARPGDAFQPRGDIDAVAHQIAVRLLDHVAEMNADSKLDPRSAAGRRCARRGRSASRSRSAPHRPRCGTRPGCRAGPLDYPPVMHGDRRDRSNRCAAPGGRDSVRSSSAPASRL